MSATQAARILNLRAALASIAGGKPAMELDPVVAQYHLELVQKCAELAICEDDEATDEETTR